MHWLLGVGIPIMMGVVNIPFYPSTINVFSSGFCFGLAVSTAIYFAVNS